MIEFDGSRDADSPPVLRSWMAVYAFVVAYTLLLIVALYILSRMFNG